MDSISAEINLSSQILGDAYEFNSPQPLLEVCARVEFDPWVGCALFARRLWYELERRDIRRPGNQRYD